MLLLSINHHYIRGTAPPRGIHPISLEVFQRRVAMLLTNFRVVSEQQLIEFSNREKMSRTGHGFY